MTSKLNAWYNNLSIIKQIVVLGLSIITLFGTALTPIYMGIVNTHNDTKESAKADIEWRKYIDQKLTRIEKKQSIEHQMNVIMMAKSGLFYFRCDKQGNTVEVAPAMLEASGWTFSDLAGENWITKIIPEEQQAIYQLKDRTVKNKTDWHCNFHFRLKNGIIVWFDSDAFMLEGSNGEIDSYIGFLSPHKE